MTLGFGQTERVVTVHRYVCRLRDGNLSLMDGLVELNGRHSAQHSTPYALVNSGVTVAAGSFTVAVIVLCEFGFIFWFCSRTVFF